MANNLQPPCAEEALALLNCVASSPYDETRCISLLSVVRSCIEKKKVVKFSLSKDGQSASAASQQNLPS